MIAVIGCLGDKNVERTFPSLSSVIGLYKSGVSRKAGFSLWQKSFYDHVIRGSQDYQEIWNYIDQNPQKWELDRFFRREM